MSEETGKIEIAQSEELGKLMFANEVIATIAGQVAFETPGVAGMSGGVVDGFAEMLGRKNLTKGIKVEVSGSDVAIEISAVFKYGTVIQDVAKEMQRNVKTAIETMTGLHVTKVGVFVQGVEFEKDTKAPKEQKEVKEQKESV